MQYNSVQGLLHPGSNSYLAVYTWYALSHHERIGTKTRAYRVMSRTIRGETYILENMGGYNPGKSGGQHKGTLTSDGGTYDIYSVNRGNNYMQFWSIRQQKRSSGVVTTKNHYDKYNALGLK